MSVATPSIAPSVTASEVSMVDFKLKANNTKSKLKALIKKVDEDKSGLVNQDIFFSLLSLHGVEISNAVQNHIKKEYGKN
jgi:hypothetical protein